MPCCDLACVACSAAKGTASTSCVANPCLNVQGLRLRECVLTERNVHAQRQLAAQMLHQQQLLQRVAAQQAQQGGQEALPNVWRPNQAFANALATSAAQQQQQQQVPGHYQAPAEGQQ